MTRQVEILNKKEFAIMVLNTDNKNFMVYIATLVQLIIMLIYSFYKDCITLLISMETLIKYFNFLNIFLSDFAAELTKYTRINNYFIN